MLRRAVPLALAATLLAGCASSHAAPASPAAIVAMTALDSAAARNPNPAPGSYNCILAERAGNARASFGFQSQGYLTLAPDSSYRFSASPMVGRYSVAPDTRAVTWTGGYFADKGRSVTTIPAGGARRVEIVWHSHDGDTRWVCGITAAAPPGSR